MEVSFNRAKYSSRILSFAADFIIMVVLTLSMMLASQAILKNVPFYQNAGKQMKDIQLLSGLYVQQSNGDVVKLTSYYSPSTQDDFKKYGDSIDASLTTFYQDSTFFSDIEKSSQHYIDLKIKSKLFVYYDDSHTTVVPKSEDLASLKKMYSFYETTIKEDATVYITKYPGYVEATKVLNLSFIFLMLLIPMIISITICEFIIPLIIGNGRRTIGKLLFKLSVVDVRGLSPSFWRFFARYIFFMFIEIILSAVSFSIPIIVSFSMFAFSKTNQSLHDYVCNTYVVDSSSARVFKNEKEYLEAKEKAEAINLSEKNVQF